MNAQAHTPDYQHIKRLAEARALALRREAAVQFWAGAIDLLRRGARRVGAQARSALAPASARYGQEA